MASLLLQLIIYVAYVHRISSKNCSAINSYVQVTEPESLSTTLTSTQALFEPYNYYVEPTELVQLSDTDNICSESINTDITDKIVLIFAANGNCSYVSRIYGAEKQGAKAVLIASDDQSSGAVSTIIDDDPSDEIKTSIPARMIPYNQAQLLAYNSPSSGSIKIEFGCYADTNTTAMLCVLDLSGDHWWMDGDYQLQVGVTKNGHSVWRKDGYLLVLDENLYMYLDAGDDADAMVWTISQDPAMEDTDMIVAKCGTTNVDHPSHCNNWFTTDYYLTSQSTFSLNDNFKVNSSLCSIPDNYICLQSSQSSLGGLYGTYHQFNKNAPFWFREWVDCDTQSGYLTFKNLGETGVFWLIDPFDLWNVAECVVTGYSPKEFDEYVAFHPEICKNWYTLVDGSLDAGHKAEDATMSVSTDACDPYECEVYDTVPSTTCMQRNSIMHSFLEGEYELTGAQGSKFNTSEYIRSEDLYYKDEHIPVYVWYYGEVDDNYLWWVISTVDLNTATTEGPGSVYGFCTSNTRSPTNCKSCWNFYFAADDSPKGSWHSDCKFQMIDGDCEDEELDKTQYEWPDYVCIRNVWHTIDNGTFTYDGDVNFNTLTGGYQINTTLTELSGVPYWWKPPNDYNDNETYIYYDQFYGYWQIGQVLHVESTLFCMEGADEYLPTHCDKWYDNEGNVMGNIFIYTTECSSSDILQITVREDNQKRKTLIVIGIIIVVGALLCGAVFCYRERRKHDDKRGFAPPSQRKAIGSVDIELGDDRDTGTLMQHGTKAGFDMRPLNVNQDDEDDDLTVDAQQHGIDDEADREDDDGDDDDEDREQLIGTDDENDEESDPDLGLDTN